MEKINLKKLLVLKKIVKSLSVVSYSYTPLTFFDYHLHQKQIEVFKNAIKQAIKLNIRLRKSKKSNFRWLKRIALSMTIMLSAYCFVNIPNALACPILQNKVVLKTIWEVLAKHKTTKKEEKASYVSQKVLVLGGIILSLSIGAILFHQTGMSRVLFTPKWEEIPLYKLDPICYTLEEKEFLNKLNVSNNLKERLNILKALRVHFGEINFEKLIKGELTINYSNSEVIFTLLARLLKQAVKIQEYENYLKGFEEIEMFINPSYPKSLSKLKEAVLNGLHQVILHNPEQLSTFQGVIETVLQRVVAEKPFKFDFPIQKAIINDMLTQYLRQRMIVGPINPN